MPEDDDTLSPRERNLRARQERRAREEAAALEGPAPHPAGCLCVECRTRDAFAWHRRMARMAPPARARLDFAAFDSSTWGAGARR